MIKRKKIIVFSYKLHKLTKKLLSDTIIPLILRYILRTYVRKTT